MSLQQSIPDRRVRDEVGNRYGRLEVLGYADAANGARWHCQCDCGRRTVSRGACLRDGSAKSCGCIAAEKLVARVRLPEGESMWNAVLRSFKGSATARGFAWELTDAEALALGRSDCAYCGAAPLARMSHPGAPDFVLYNGIDRVDNGVGYQRGNVVACCKHCNVAKRDRSVGDFINWARAVAARAED